MKWRNCEGCRSQVGTVLAWQVSAGGTSPRPDTSKLKPGFPSLYQRQHIFLQLSGWRERTTLPQLLWAEEIPIPSIGACFLHLLSSPARACFARWTRVNLSSFCDFLFSTCPKIPATYCSPYQPTMRLGGIGSGAEPAKPIACQLEPTVFWGLSAKPTNMEHWRLLMRMCRCRKTGK